MQDENLKPRLDLLAQEYVLVQAWKKTASYIRSHNWYSDSLALDVLAINLPQFLEELAGLLKNPNEWKNDPLRVVPAPKSQRWRITKSKSWEPSESGISGAKLRPLAHVSLKDQVAATAVMLCLADRVETIQGDPCISISDSGKRKNVISYGNRLFCDVIDTKLRHRWGSAKLYRSYFQDYRTFISRPEVVAESAACDSARVIVVHSDLRQFYDRVHPNLLGQKLRFLIQADDDLRFYEFARRLLDWEWHKKDSREISIYAQQSGLSDFSRIALPQGLVSAGFFANVFLLDFDRAVREAFSTEISPGIQLEDACRYVDDLRFVLSVKKEIGLLDVEILMKQWIQKLLDRYAEGLVPSEEKTRAAAFRGDDRPLVRQSRKMARIQGAISGGFDAIAGNEILDAVQGLMRSQQRYSERRTNEQSWSFSPIPDVRDDTVARFAANRFRSTYRSLRPLLADDEPVNGTTSSPQDRAVGSREHRSQSELDNEVRAFALGLIENWVEDPSNVRLLRIGLDLWPADDILKNVLDLLRPFTEKGGRRGAPRRVAWYCLAEIFRAGATETGFVEDRESLPAEIDIDAYRALLVEEAARLAALPSKRLPWYLKQQLYLFLAANPSSEYRVNRKGTSDETKHYRELIGFLQGSDSAGSNFPTLSILARRSFRGPETIPEVSHRKMSVSRLEQIAARDPSFALEILAARPDLMSKVSPRLRDDLCLDLTGGDPEWKPLAAVILADPADNPLRNELTLLRFASSFLDAYPKIRELDSITPSDVMVKLEDANPGTQIVDVRIVPSRVASRGSLYNPPKWCQTDERWRFQLGYLLRFILSAKPDFTRVVRPLHWKEGTATYRASESHWYQRLYGLFSAQAAFGDDWLPITDWTERLLYSLLRWPGSRVSQDLEIGKTFELACDAIKTRINEIESGYGQQSRTLILPIRAPRAISGLERPLRACVVQTVIPAPEDFVPGDLTLSQGPIRKRHRNHLSAALGAIERMLDLRETHKELQGRLDWLIFPELSVHPRDVRTHLIPFARAHKTIILAGLTYECLSPGKPLVNSALWIIPVRSPAHGVQIVTRRQCKLHLAPQEDTFNASGTVLHGLRPCQWLIGYDWAAHTNASPLWLTASICYDATDLSLAADLRDLSDVFAIPALNKDVSTFDQMALALHYHMFQLVIVANNGGFGGSNAYIPYREPHLRQVFHLHGQPQASIAFWEVDPISSYLQRKIDGKNQTARIPTPATSSGWKNPPAGIHIAPMAQPAPTDVKKKKGAS